MRDLDEVREEVLAGYRKGWRNRLRWAFSRQWRVLAELDAEHAVAQHLRMARRRAISSAEA